MRLLLVIAMCKAGIHGGCDSLFVEHPQPAPPPSWRQHIKSCDLGVAQQSGFANRRMSATKHKRLLRGRHLHVRLSVHQLVFRKRSSQNATSVECTDSLLHVYRGATGLFHHKNPWLLTGGATGGWTEIKPLRSDRSAKEIPKGGPHSAGEVKGQSLDQWRLWRSIIV